MLIAQFYMPPAYRISGNGFVQKFFRIREVKICLSPGILSSSSS